MGLKPRPATATRSRASGLPPTRRYVRTSFSPSKHVPYTCPTCGEGRLVLDEKLLHSRQTAKSKEDEQNYKGAWHDENEWRRFAGILVCERPACQEVVAVVGEMHYVPTYGDDDRQEDFAAVYEPNYMDPAPKFFEAPRKAPGEIEPELQRAFSAFWSDSAACANRIRCVVELMMNEQGYPDAKKTGGFIPLAVRIAAWRRKNRRFAAVGRALEAVKWIGNDGSHPGDTLTKDDLFRGFRMLEHALVEVYDRRRERDDILKLAKHYTPKVRRKQKPKNAAAPRLPKAPSVAPLSPVAPPAGANSRWGRTGHGA